ncbi:MAG: CNNM domain-containing protein [Holosporales bacterium]|jgi:Mg2+/Co2+ transporter CorB|nr:CNNM domain-containing protein [Holosporales bacterium]
MPPLYTFFVVLLLLLVVFSGFFSGAETALTGASRAHLHQLSKSGNKRAKLVKSLQEKFASSISTILITNQMTNHVIVTISTWLTINMFGEGKVPIAAVLVAVFVIVYTEILPKMLAIHSSLKFSLFAAPVIRWAIIILKPLTTLLEAAGKASLRLVGIKINPEVNKVVTDEELLGAIEMHSQTGQEEKKKEKVMLKGILDLDDVTVGKVMVHRKSLMTIDCGLPTSQVIKEVLNCPYSRIPIWKDNPENILGILHTKSLFRAMKQSELKLSQLNILSLASQPWFIPETTNLLNQLCAFRERRSHLALVVDEYGDLMGLVTLEDIVEEIVGEIADEYDVGTSGIKVQQDGSILANGSVPVRDLNREFDWSLPEGASTIAGLVMQEARRIPEIGQSFTIRGLNIEILKRQSNQINLMKITAVPDLSENV